MFYFYHPRDYTMRLMEVIVKLRRLALSKRSFERVKTQLIATKMASNPYPQFLLVV